MDLALSDEPLGAGVRRIAVGLVDAALAALDAADAPAETRVHEVRKRCKETRAVLRLVRPGLAREAYRRQNGLLRDAGRVLSPIRDAHAVLATFDALVAADGPRTTIALDPARAELVRRAANATASVQDDDRRIRDARALLERARDEIAAWDLPDDWGVLRGGVKRIHGRARREMASARETGDVDAFHDWRKRVKYLWYHLQILRRIAPDLIDPLAASHKVLSDTLGDAHDLVVLVDEVGADPERVGGPAVVDAVRSLAAWRREDLECRAVNLGARLHAERSGAFVSRLDGWYAATLDVGDAVPAGPIVDVADTAPCASGGGPAETAR